MKGRMGKFLTRALCLVWALALCLGCTLTALAAGESCEFCGGEIPEGIVICPHCWVCAECGAQNKENATVCAQCGAQNAGGGASGGASEDGTGEGSGDSSGSASEDDSSSPDSDSSSADSTDGISQRPTITQNNVNDFAPMELETIYFNNNLGDPYFFCYPADLPLPLNIAKYLVADDPESPWLLDHILTTPYTLENASGKTVYEFSTSVMYELTSESWDSFESSKELLSSTPGWKFVGESDVVHENPPKEIRYYDFETEQTVAVRDRSDGRIKYIPACEITFAVDADIKNGERTNFEGWMGIDCPVAEDVFPLFDLEESPERDTGSGSSGGNQIIQLEDGTYVTVDENGQINTDPSYSGIVQKEDGTYTNQTDTLPVPEYRDYEVGDIIMLAGVPFVLMLVAGVPTWVGPGGIGMDGQSLIPEEGPADTGPAPQPTEPDSPKEPQEEPPASQEPEVDKGREFAKYVTELRKENPWITQLTDLVVLANKQGLFKNAQGVKGFMEVYKGFMNYNDFIAQGDDPAFASVKTVITQGIQLAFSKEIGISDIALRAAQDQLMKSIQEFENLTGINTDHLGLRDMVTGAGKSISPGENIKQITNVSLDLMKECYGEFLSRDHKSNLAGMVDDYRAGKYGENLKNLQLGIDLLSDLTEGKPVLEEIQEGYKQMGLDMMEEFTRRWTKQ